MKNTASLFTQNVDNITAIPFFLNDDKNDPEAELLKFCTSIGKNDVALVLTDILYGSVNQKIVLALGEMPNAHIIAGMNLPLLLELITLEESDINEKTISEKCNACKDSIVYMRNYEIQHSEDDE